MVVKPDDSPWRSPVPRVLMIVYLGQVAETARSVTMGEAMTALSAQNKTRSVESMVVIQLGVCRVAALTGSGERK